MVAGVTHDEAIAKLGGERRTFWRDLRAALDGFGVPHAGRPRRVSSWSNIAGIAIVKCSAKDNGNWHWVVVDGPAGLVYDPMREAPLPVQNVRRPIVSYLQVNST
jgi:hypothetical protein